MTTQNSNLIQIRIIRIILRCEYKITTINLGFMSLEIITIIDIHIVY